MNAFKHPHDPVTTPGTDSKKRKVENAKKNAEELKQVPNMTPSSSITCINSYFSSNFLVWSSHYNY
jgi:hypothetical protein